MQPSRLVGSLVLLSLPGPLQEQGVLWAPGSAQCLPKALQCHSSDLKAWKSVHCSTYSLQAPRECLLR